MRLKFRKKVFIIVFAICLILGALYVRGGAYLNVSGEYEAAELDSHLVSVKGYDRDGNVFKVTEDDPQLVFAFGQKSYGIAIEFEREPKASEFQVFYGWDSPEFSEVDSNILCIEDKRADVFLAGGFSYVRIDIDSDFEIKSMEAVYDIVHTKSSNTMKYILAFAVSLCLALVLSLFEQPDKKLSMIGNKIAAGGRKLLKNRKKAVFAVLISLLILMLSFLTEYAYKWYKGNDYINKYRVLVIFSAVWIVYCIVAYRKYMLKYMQFFYFIILMLIGTLHVAAAPPAAGISWDDEIHYGRTAYLSWGADGKISYSDYRLINRYVRVINTKDVYNAKGRSEWAAEINASSSEGYSIVDTSEYEVSVSYIAYIPSSIGMRLGRGLGLSFTHIFMLGKWINLLCYSLAFSCAIALFGRRGKLIAAVLGLIPTSIFMATSYSYDWWVICLTVLGYAIFINGLQKEGKISTKRLVCAVAVMVLAILPKAVYFPLIFPMLMLKREKYDKPKLCRWLCVGAMVFLLGTFMLPMFLGGAGGGDIRGGTEVNSSEQIKYILANPLEYAHTLTDFLEGYLSPDNSYMYLTLMAYHGLAGYYTLCIVVIAIAAVMDNGEIGERQRIGGIARGSVFLAAFGSIVLVATALYISFTAVASKTIDGCQPRYILPVLLPVLYFALEMNIKVPGKIKTGVFSAAVTAMSYVFLYAVYSLCITYY